MGLVRYHVLVVIGLASRRVEIAGIVHQPAEAWMEQLASRPPRWFLRPERYLMMDRDTEFTNAFRSLLLSSGVKERAIAGASLTMNTYAERFVRSMRGEYLGQDLPAEGGAAPRSASGIRRVLACRAHIRDLRTSSSNHSTVHGRMHRAQPPDRRSVASY